VHAILIVQKKGPGETDHLQGFVEAPSNLYQAPRPHRFGRSCFRASTSGRGREWFCWHLVSGSEVAFSTRLQNWSVNARSR